MKNLKIDVVLFLLVLLVFVSCNNTPTIKQNHKEFIGQWRDDALEDIIYRMKIVNGTFVLEIFSPSQNSASDMKDFMKKEKRGNQILFVTGNKFGEYYILEDNGDLSAYDVDGFITTYSKID